MDRLLQAQLQNLKGMTQDEPQRLASIAHSEDGAGLRELIEAARNKSDYLAKEIFPAAEDAYSVPRLMKELQSEFGSGPELTYEPQPNGETITVSCGGKVVEEFQLANIDDEDLDPAVKAQLLAGNIVSQRA